LSNTTSPTSTRFWTRTPDNNPQYIVVIHFFDTTEAAENFRTFLREQIWTSTDVRGLRSDPQAMIQHEVDAGP